MDNQIKYTIPKNIAEHFSPIEQRLIMRLYALASQVWSYDDQQFSFYDSSNPSLTKSRKCSHESKRWNRVSDTKF